MNLPFARVLIVDDERHSQLRLQFALEQAGFQCDLARDGMEALQKIIENRYHAVVTELVLPNTNGGDLVIKLCGQECRSIIVVHTRALEQEVYCSLKEEGVDSIYYKPADYAVMARGIRATVEEHLASPTGRFKNWQQDSDRSLPSDIARMLRQGDGWIQDSSVRVEVFRFSIMVLACVLFGLGWGRSLDVNMAGICKMFGLSGFAFYFCLELVAYHRNQQRMKLLRWSMERRLTDHVEYKSDHSLPALMIDNMDEATQSLVAK